MKDKHKSNQKLYVLEKMFHEFVENTPKKAKITLKIFPICNLTKTVMKATGILNPQVFMGTKCLKHLYDKRPPDEFNVVLDCLPKVIKNPDKILQNLKGKKGELIFLKSFGKNGAVDIIASLERVYLDDDIKDELQVVSAFIRRKNYMKNCKVIWSWKGDNPSS